jgi:DUF4097 and DUF4098 domain-containing protein YvlB
MNHRFATPTPPRLRIEFRAGSILVRTDDVEETTVDLRGRRDNEATRNLIAETTIEQRGNEIVVLVPKRAGGLFGRSPELELEVSSPRLTALAIESGSADITGEGDFATSSVVTGAGDLTIDHIAGSARVRSGSGDVRVEAIDGDADVTAGSADVELRAVGGALSVTTGSGDLRLGEGGTALDVKSGSGDISVQLAPERLSAKTGSGDVSIDSVRRGEITARTASGDIRAGVRAGTAAWLDVRTISGRVSSDLDAAGEPTGDEDRVRLRLETVSGDIELVRVAGDQHVRPS